MEEMAQTAQVGTPPRNTKIRGWCFTWNNYTEEDVAYLELILKNNSTYIIGKEVGTSGTAHLQGFIYFNNARTFTSVRKILKNNHIEPCKNIAASKQYCKKEGNYITNIEETVNNTLDDQWDKYMHETYDEVKWYDWQANVLETLNNTPNNRDIYWIHENIGNKGKSWLARYIDWKYKCVIVNGKQNDVFHGIKMFIEQNKVFPKVVIVDIPRTSQNYVCYGTMEKIKDGLMYSGKYEGGKIRLLPLHLIVFANFEPDRHSLSIDRLKIVNLNE